MAKKKPDKVWVVRKIIHATSVSEALRKEKRTEPAEILQCIGKGSGEDLTPSIGFSPLQTKIDEDGEN